MTLAEAIRIVLSRPPAPRAIVPATIRPDDWREQGDEGDDPYYHINRRKRDEDGDA